MEDKAPLNDDSSSLPPPIAASPDSLSRKALRWCTYGPSLQCVQGDRWVSLAILFDAPCLPLLGSFPSYAARIKNFQRELNAKTHVDFRGSFHRIQLDEQVVRASMRLAGALAEQRPRAYHAFFCSRRIRTEALARPWRKTCNTVASAEHTFKQDESRYRPAHARLFFFVCERAEQRDALFPVNSIAKNSMVLSFHGSARSNHTCRQLKQNEQAAMET